MRYLQETIFTVRRSVVREIFPAFSFLLYIYKISSLTRLFERRINTNNLSLIHSIDVNSNEPRLILPNFSYILSQGRLHSRTTFVFTRRSKRSYAGTAASDFRYFTAPFFLSITIEIKKKTLEGRKKREQDRDTGSSIPQNRNQLPAGSNSSRGTS